MGDVNGSTAVKRNLLSAAFDDEDDGFLDGVFIDADPEVKDCKQNCIDKMDCHDTDGNVCKNECKKKCKDDPDYDPDDDDDDEDDDRDRSIEDCKDDCIDDQCKKSDDTKDCKKECKKRCEDDSDYSDWSSSFSYDGDILAWENGNGSTAVKRNLLSAAFDDEGGDFLDGVVLGADKTQNKDCKDKCPKDKDSCKDECKRICKSDPDAYPDDDDEDDDKDRDRDDDDDDCDTKVKDCKDECIDYKDCKNKQCKNKCEDICEDYPCAYDYIYDNTAWENGNGSTAVKTNLRKREI